MKKFRNLIYSIIMVGVLMSTIILSSFSQADKVLLNAEEITKKLLEVGLAEDEELGYISTSYVKGLDGNEDYILAVCETGGYAIYEKETYELIEYSPIGNSPYNQIAENDSYYAGPVNYFKKVDNNYESLTTHEKINVSSGKAIALNLKGKLQTDRESRKQKAEKDVIENGTAIQSTKGNEAISLTNNISTEEINFNKRPADNYNFSDRVYIDNYQYFINNIYHGENYAGSCSSVATQLLLAYNDWCIDGRLIPFKTGETGNQFVTYTEQDYSIRANVYGADMRGTTSTYVENDGITTFYELILSSVNSDVPPPNEFYDLPASEQEKIGGANLYVIKNFVSIYTTDYISNNFGVVTMDVEYDISTPLNLLADIQNEINEDRPLILSIHTYNADGTVKGSHAVVVYGYQDVLFKGQVLTGYIANFGYDAAKSNLWFNASWTKGYFSLQIEHEHITTVFDPIDENGNKINTNTGHLLECSICKVVLPNNNHIFDRNNPIKIDEYNNSATNYHYIVCSCGFKEKERHFFSERYLKLNADPNEQASYHTKACKCGFEMQEEHWFKSGRTVCMYCGYGA